MIPATVAAELAATSGVGSMKGGPLFPAPEGRRPQRGQLEAAGVGARGGSVGGRPCRFHHLRHSQASLVSVWGCHPKLMSRRFGHASTRITERYSHAYQDWTVSRGADERVAP